MHRRMEETHGHLHELAPARTRAHVCSRVQAFDEAEGIDKLEALQEHKNANVYDKAVEILEAYFGEEEDEDENLAPNVSGGGFSFGGAALAPAVGQQPAFAF